MVLPLLKSALVVLVVCPVLLGAGGASADSAKPKAPASAPVAAGIEPGAKALAPPGTASPESGAKVAVPSGTASPESGAKVAVPAGTASPESGAKVFAPSGTASPESGAKVAAPAGTASPESDAKFFASSGTASPESGAKVFAPAGTASPESDAKFFASSGTASPESGAKVAVPSGTDSLKSGASASAPSDIAAPSGTVLGAKALAPSGTVSGAKALAPSGTASLESGAETFAPSGTASLEFGVAPTAGLDPTSGTVDLAVGAEPLVPGEVATEEAGEDSAEPVSPEGETEVVTAAPGTEVDGPLYSAELPDDELAKRFVEDAASLGSVSLGFAHAGRMMNAVQLEAGTGYSVVVPQYAWTTQEVVDYLASVGRNLQERLPGLPPLRVNHISRKDGGYLRPHSSHQSGRDVDLGFFYRDGAGPVARRGNRDHLIDLEANWTLLEALVTHSDVQVILVDKRIQKVLYDWALAHGRDRAWLEGLFLSGAASMVQHARGHKDHFHVRFFSGRAQELGRRLQPLLAKKPEQNILFHKIRKGETLGHIAVRYGSSVKLIQRANGLKGHMLRLGRTLSIPIRGPCTQCPLPPPVRVPPRRLPPPMPQAALPSAQGLERAGSWPG